MNRSLQIAFTLALLTVSGLNQASGQRTTKVTSEGIAKYKNITLEAASIPATPLHYVGSVGQQHLLMVTKTSHSSRVDPDTGRKIIGRPSDHVFKYTISADEISINNGWDITSLLDEGGFTVRPSYCPRLTLTEKNKTYTLIENPEVKKACLTMRRPRIR